MNLEHRGPLGTMESRPGEGEGGRHLCRSSAGPDRPAGWAAHAAGTRRSPAWSRLPIAGGTAAAVLLRGEASALRYASPSGRSLEWLIEGTEHGNREFRSEPETTKPGYRSSPSSWRGWATFTAADSSKGSSCSLWRRSPGALAASHYSPPDPWYGSSASGLWLCRWGYGFTPSWTLSTPRRTPPEYVLKDYNRWYVYLLLLFLPVPVSVGWSMHVRRDHPGVSHGGKRHRTDDPSG